MKNKIIYVKKGQEQAMSIKDYMIEQSANKDVKIIETEIPFQKDYFLSDLSLSFRGEDEDKAYTFSEKLRTNIRRGNSVIFQVDAQNNPSEYYWGRRGIMKFFDLQREYIEYNLKEIQELTQFGNKNASLHKELYSIIFKEAQESFTAGDSVSIYKLVKANGENAQISYFKPLNSWVISSKNVALLARQRSDIDLYTKDRFGFAKLIAQVWFNILEKIHKEQGDEKVEAIKQDLSDQTMVGEYCGNQDYQHLVKYENIDILFYAIVNHKSNDPCIPPLQAYEVFNKYNLTTVKLIDEGSYNTSESFNNKLKQVYDFVASSDIEGEQEGSVLYFVKKSKQIPQQERTLSVSKLKTLEYRIFRKLREKLKNYVSKKDQRLRNKFEEETKQLCVNNPPAHPLDFYFQIGKLSFDFVDQYSSQAGIIADQYISFLSVIIYCLENNQKPNPTHFEKENMKKLLEVPWSNYSSFQAKNNDEKINVETLNDLKLKQAINTNQRNLFVIIPISIPGMGKSTFVKYFSEVVKENKDEIFVISSDNIRRDLMDNLKKNKPFLKEDQLFSQTGKQAGKEFSRSLSDCVSNKPLQTKAQNVFIFLDKNYPPNAIDKVVQEILENKPTNMNLQICAMMTSETEPNKYKIGSNIGFPFSLNFFFNCANRVQTRAEHPTLTNKSGKSMDVMVMFFNLFRNSSLSDHSLQANGIDIILKFPFIKDDSNRKFSQDIVDRFEEIILQTIPGNTCNNQALVQSFADRVKNLNLQFENTPIEEIKLRAQDTYYECINQVNQKGGQLNQVQESKQNNISQENTVSVDQIEEAKQSDMVIENHQESQTQKLTVRMNQKRKAAVKFNPPRKPIYLGIFANDESLVQQTQKRYVKDNLLSFFNKYGDDIIKSNHDDLLNKVFKHPASHHITTYFVKQAEGIYYENFEEGLSIPIEVLAMAYVPNKIICGVCLPDPNMIDIENKIPHMTLYVDEWAPRFSNNVLQALFTDKDAPLAKELQNGSLLDINKEIIGKYKLPVQEQNGLHDVYFIKPKNYIMKFDATTKAFFGNGPQQNNKKFQNKKR
ncbi:hypothetical protein ABPG74_008597 [Tetrahymena malaccensis]